MGGRGGFEEESGAGDVGGDEVCFGVGGYVGFVEGGGVQDGVEGVCGEEGGEEGEGGDGADVSGCGGGEDVDSDGGVVEGGEGEH